MGYLSPLCTHNTPQRPRALHTADATFSVQTLIEEKTSTRMPEVLYMGFEPLGCSAWTVDKYDEPTPITNIVNNGSFHLHATTGNASCVMSGSSNMVKLETIDAALVSFIPLGMDEFTTFPIPFLNGTEDKGMAFTLSNNMWGTVSWSY